MLGVRDSEVGIKISKSKTAEDQGLAAKLRMRLWLEHLGHLEPLPGVEGLSAAEKESLQDPTSDACWKLWQNMAERNTEAFFKLLSVWPDSSLRSWGDFH